MRRLLILLLALILALPLAANTVFAQSEAGEQRIEIAQRRTLFDLLFGPKEPPTPPATTQTTRQPLIQRTQTAAPSVVIPEILEKAEGATRMVIFGDSLAIDLAKAFQRAYAEDPNISIVGKGVGSSGFVRDDFYDWNGALSEEIAADSFDLAVLIIGINDKQAIGQTRPLSDEWKALYLERLNVFLAQLRVANKPIIWVGLPPMRASGYSASISEIASIHRLASISAGVEYVDIYERFLDDNGRYASRGPNLNGEDALMRKNDGIHFSSAGSDKLVFFVNQVLKNYYRGGTVSVEVFDPLEGTDTQAMTRPPFQGNGQFRLLEVAGAVLPLSSNPVRAVELVLTDPQSLATNPFGIEMLYMAPVGRADDFGVGVDPVALDEGDGQIETIVQ